MSEFIETMNKLAERRKVLENLIRQENAGVMGSANHIKVHRWREEIAEIQLACGELVEKEDLVQRKIQEEQTIAKHKAQEAAKVKLAKSGKELAKAANILTTRMEQINLALLDFETKCREHNQNSTAAGFGKIERLNNRQTMLEWSMHASAPDLAKLAGMRRPISTHKTTPLSEVIAKTLGVTK